MDFSTIDVDADTQAFMAEVEAFCDEHVTEAVIDEDFRTGNSHNAGLHRALGRKGWIFPRWPVERGGAGLDAERAAIITRALLARHAPMITMGTTTNVASAVQRWMRDDLRDDILGRAARGEACFCLGYSEPDCGSDLAAVRTRATRDGDEWVISGQKMFTTGAQNSHYCFLLARSDPDAPKHKGLTMFLVPLDLPGIEIQAVHTLGGERTNMVFYDEVRVPDDYRLGPPGQGWMVLHGPLNEEHMMDADGPKPVEEEAGENTMFTSMSITSLAHVVEWARVPRADGTRPIDDPLVREKLAQVALDLELTAATPGPPGRVVAADLLIRDTAMLVDVVGPAALIARGEPGAVGDGWVEFAHRFAQGSAIYGGSTDVFRNMLAERFLGMPRSRPSER